jgi:hypothetical protein
MHYYYYYYYHHPHPRAGNDVLGKESESAS